MQAKVELLNDCNEYRKSSSGVHFFCSSKLPDGYTLVKFCGFVEELVVNDDPEYQWIDKIRAPRTSNEARQKLFSKLSGEVQRRLGLKVQDMEANCVLGYLQYFDLEGEHGIVVRGIGTAALISKQQSTANKSSYQIVSSVNAKPSISPSFSRQNNASLSVDSSQATTPPTPSSKNTSNSIY